MARTPDTRFGVIVESDFSRGVVRDSPRHTIPNGGLYDSADFMLERPGLAYKRGGWVYQSDAFGTSGKATKAVMFMAEPVRVLAIGENNTAYDITSGSSASIGSVGFAPLQNPPSYLNSTLILTDAANSVAPKKLYWTGSALAVADLGGSPPTAGGAAVHLGRVLLCSTAANPNRIFFGPLAGEDGATSFEDTWDTASKYIDVSNTITGLASVQGALIVFGPRACERILGGIPPGVTGVASDMELQPIGDVGCIDARSIVVVDNNVIFASHAGVHMTNASGIVNLMERSDGSGILSYWQSLFSTTTFTAVAGGMLGRNYYFINVLNAPASGASTSAGTFICYLPTRTWWRVTNLAATMFASGLTEAGTHRLFAALSNTNRAASLESMLTPSSAYKNDGDGTAVTPTLTTRVLAVDVGPGEIGHGHLTYDMRDAATDNPTLAITAAPGLNAASFATAAESPLAETSDMDRGRFVVNATDTQGVTVKITQANASSKTEIARIELEHRAFGSTGEGP